MTGEGENRWAGDAQAPAGSVVVAGRVFGVRVAGRLPEGFSSYLRPSEERDASCGEAVELRFRRIDELPHADELWTFEPQPPFAQGRYALFRHPGGFGLSVAAEGTGRFLLTTSAIEIEWLERAAAAPHHLFSHAFPLWLESRGITVLHASAVGLGAGAVAFVGSSGVGKSTLCAELLRSGCELVADDALAACERAGRGWWCAHGPPMLRLWPSAFEDRLQRPVEGLERVHPGSDKRRLAAVPSAGSSRPPLERRILAIYELVRASSDASVQIVHETRREGLVRLIAHSLAAGPAAALGWSEERFDRLSSLARSVPVRTLLLPGGADTADTVRDAIEKDLEGLS